MPAATGPKPTSLRQKSILDHVKPRDTSLGAQLGASDAAKLDQHLSKIREIELGLDNAVSGGAACKPPTLIDTTGYNPTMGGSGGAAAEGCSRW